MLVRAKFIQLPIMTYKNILRVIITVLTVSAACWAYYIFQNPEGRVHPQLVPPDSYWLSDADLYNETGIVAIGGREFEIPVAYVDGQFKDGRKEGSVVLSYVLPDFKSPLEFTNKSERQALVRQGRMKGMLVENQSDKASLDYYFERMLARNRAASNRSARYGLEAYLSTAPHDRTSTGPDDFYIERGADESITSIIQCSPSWRVPNPNCSQMFNRKGLRYKVRMSAGELPDWENQRDRAVNFFESFEITKQ